MGYLNRVFDVQLKEHLEAMGAVLEVSLPFKVVLSVPFVTRQ